MFQQYGSNKKDDLHQYTKQSFPKFINKVDNHHENLLHQLRVQQLTLEIQNKELLEALELAAVAQERLNAVFEFAPVACLVITRDGIIKQITNCAAKMFGMASGLPLAEFICQDDQAVLFRFLESAFSSEENPHCEVTFQFGENRYCAVIKAEIDKYLQTCLVTISDTSRQRQNSEKPVDNLVGYAVSSDLNEAKINSIFNSSIEVIITYDIYRKIVSTNSAVETVFGYKPKELIGCHISKLIPLLSSVLNECRCSKDDEKQVSRTIEIGGIHKTGSIVPLDLASTFYSAGDKCFFTIILRDVSLRKSLERQDTEHLSELAHVTRLGLMGEMASGIAHEVNQPLSAICSYAQACVGIINSEDPDLAILSDILQKMQKQAFRAGEIIHHMREFVRNNPKHRTSVDIYTLINEAVSLCTDDIRQNNIKLIIDQEINLPRLNNIDHIQIEQVLINLIRNAIDVLQCLPEDWERRLSIQVSLTADSEISIRVKDNGPGIPLDEQLKIFMPFFTTKSEGMGMGLSISRSIIEAHGGYMRFNSKQGKGSSFYFTLPIK